MKLLRYIIEMALRKTLMVAKYAIVTKCPIVAILQQRGVKGRKCVQVKRSSVQEIYRESAMEVRVGRRRL